MHAALVLIPIISTLMAWLMIRLFIQYFFKPVTPIKAFGLSFQGIIPKKQDHIAIAIAAFAAKELLNPEMIHEKLAGPETLRKAMPAIEEHIDHFINVKLKESLPVISMFIGDRVTNQLKELFMKELEELFPSVMSQFIDGFLENNGIEKEITLKISAIPVSSIKENFYRIFRKELNKIELAFAATGFIMGIIQLAVILVV